MTFGDVFGTFIPNNTAPKESVTRSEGLKTLREELVVNSFADESLLWKWKGVMISTLTAVLLVPAIFTFGGCCLIPCIPSLQLM